MDVFNLYETPKNFISFSNSELRQLKMMMMVVVIDGDDNGVDEEGDDDDDDDDSCFVGG